MDVYKCVAIMCHMVLHVHCSANTTVHRPGAADLLVTNILISKNETSTASNIMLSSKSTDNIFIIKSPTNFTRRLLIVNPEIPTSLRANSKGKNKKKKEKGVTSLLYQEMDEKTGEILNQVWMYNLEDVKNFFHQYLEVIICEFSIDECDEDDKKEKIRKK